MSDIDAAVALVETPSAAADPMADDASLSTHESVFGAPDQTLDPEAKAKNDEVRAKVRHRAKSQQASPEDVPRIAELTRKLREAETERDGLKARQAPQSLPSVDRPLGTAAPVAEGGTPRAAVEPTRAKPSEDDIGATYATYAEFVEDLTDWKVEQREAATAARQQAQQAEQQQTQARQDWHQSHQTYQGRMATFAAAHPDFQGLIDTHKGINLPAPAYAAILKDDNGPAFVYHLLTHLDQLAEVQFLMEGKPPTEDNVAHATRWLSRRTQAVSTGSAAPTPSLTLAPRPPNPVRTGPMKTGDEPPGDESSLADHEKAYGARRK